MCRPLVIHRGQRRRTRYMSSANWIVRGVRLDDGNETELAITD
jgi:hypothetical protein